MPKEIRTLVVEEICPWPYYQPYPPYEKVEIVKRAYVRRKPLIKKGKTPWQKEQEKKRAERSSRKQSCSGTASGRRTRSAPSEGTAATM